MLTGGGVVTGGATGATIGVVAAGTGRCDGRSCTGGRCRGSTSCWRSYRLTDASPN